MSVGHTLEQQPALRRSAWATSLRTLFGPGAASLTALGVFLAVFLSWQLWSRLPFGHVTPLELHLRFGIATAIVTLAVTMLRHEHRIGFYADGENTLRAALKTWHIVTFVLVVAMFLTRRVDDLSRGVFVLSYGLGFLTFWLSRKAFGGLLHVASHNGLLIAPRILVVGTDDGIRSFLGRYQPWKAGLQVLGTIALTPETARNPHAPSPDFLRAVELARTLDIDDVYVAVPWSDTETIDLCVEMFLNTPVSIHLAPERVLDRFDQVAIARVGQMASLELTRPMTPGAVALKRLVDVGAAALGLLLLLPLFALVALLIKLDTPGPVFFRQTRYGFNQRRFSIFKFRTMTTFADEGDVPQAERGDPRITRTGRWLRRSNVDELPQLLNVLIGQMSLVGPRPHAVPHNRAFEQRIALYARRHNVRPGITGWAQVNGLRGETDTDDKMARRVEYDLFYIDNWSIQLDLRIILQTVFSAAGYRNAY